MREIVNINVLIIGRNRIESLARCDPVGPAEMDKAPTISNCGMTIRSSDIHVGQRMLYPHD